MSKLCPHCQYFVWGRLLSNIVLILLVMEFTQAAQFVTGILFYSSMMTSRSWWMKTPCAPPPSTCWCSTQAWLRTGLVKYLGTPSPSPSASSGRQLSSGRCVWVHIHVGKAQFVKRGDHALLQSVTVHIGIYVCLNEPQLPSAGSTHVAPDHDTTTTMLDCRQNTIILVLHTRAPPHMLDTIWAKQVYLITSDHRHGASNSCSLTAFLRQTVVGLSCEPASEEASFWDDGHADCLDAECDVWSEHWLTSCYFNLSSNAGSARTCFLDMTQSMRTKLLWWIFAWPVLSGTRLEKSLYDPGDSTVAQF